MNKKVVLVGVTSSIAVYKSLELVRLLREKHLEVFVIMTEKATQMISPQEFEKASQHPVFVDLFPKGFDYTAVLKEQKVEHIEVADAADVMVIAPATAHTIAKISHGMADDFLTTTALATTAPRIICPSMNVNMWRNPVTQENIQKLKKLGFHIVGPASGMLACGYEGEGRLEDIQVIKDEILHCLNRTQSLKNRKIMVTTGGTIERIDDVRYITNRSSGKMGVALAESCYERGAEVLFLRARGAVQPRYQIPEELFETADDLSRLIKTHISQFDTIYHTAAVSDFQLSKPIQGKIAGDTDITLHLTSRKKILDSIKKQNPRITLIAFKAEAARGKEEKLIQKAYQRLKMCGADAIVVNDVSKNDRGFQVDTNEVHVVFPNGKSKKIPLGLKRDIADSIVDIIEKKLHRAAL